VGQFWRDERVRFGTAGSDRVLDEALARFRIGK
jgi:hypothetical protein